MTWHRWLIAACLAGVAWVLFLCWATEPIGPERFTVPDGAPALHAGDYDPNGPGQSCPLFNN